jgi:hypothetical protein
MAVTTLALGVASGGLTSHDQAPSAEQPWRDGIESKSRWYPCTPASAIRTGDDTSYTSCHCHTNRGHSGRVCGSPQGGEDVYPRMTRTMRVCARSVRREGPPPTVSGQPTGVAPHRRPRTSGAGRRFLSIASNCCASSISPLRVHEQATRKPIASQLPVSRCTAGLP